MVREPAAVRVVRLDFGVTPQNVEEHQRAERDAKDAERAGIGRRVGLLQEFCDATSAHGVPFGFELRLGVQPRLGAGILHVAVAREPLRRKRLTAKLSGFRRLVLDPPDVEGDELVLGFGVVAMPISKVVLQVLAVRNVPVETNPILVVARELIVPPAFTRERIEIGLLARERVELATVFGAPVHDDAAVFVRGLGREHAPALEQAERVHEMHHPLGAMDLEAAIDEGVVVHDLNAEHDHDHGGRRLARKGRRRSLAHARNVSPSLGAGFSSARGWRCDAAGAQPEETRDGDAVLRESAVSDTAEHARAREYAASRARRCRTGARGRFRRARAPPCEFSPSGRGRRSCAPRAHGPHPAESAPPRRCRRS